MIPDDLRTALGEAVEALRFRLDWLNEWGDYERKHYEPGEWDLMVQDVEDAITTLEDFLHSTNPRTTTPLDNTMPKEATTP